MLKLDKQYLTFRCEVLSVDKDAGTVDALIPMSTGNVDRMEDIIEPNAYKKTLKQFMKRPVFVSSHDYYDLTKQIGHFETLEIVENGLMGKPKWYVGMGNPEADWGFKLAEMKMAAFSVGFIPLKWDKIDKDKDDFFGNRRFTEVDLLEISQVIVPANREAIQGLKAKSLKDAVKNQLAADMETERVWEVAVKLEGKTTKPEETEDFIRIPNPEDKEDHDDDDEVKTIDISKDEGIQALYCVTHKVIMTYLFDKEKDWTKATAEEWVKDHAKSVGKWLEAALDSTELPFKEWLKVHPASTEEADEEAISKIARTINRIRKGKGPSQQELADEMAYLSNCVAKVGISAQFAAIGWELVRQVLTKTPTGRDIPDDILTKAGAVLNAKNKADIVQAMELLSNVLSRSEREEEQESYTSPEPPSKEQVAEAVRQVLAESKASVVLQQEEIKAAVMEVFDELRGKVK